MQGTSKFSFFFFFTLRHRRYILDKYTQILLEQGAEYTSMGDIFAKNLDNPVIIGLDHPKMKQFYNLNHPVCVIYGLKNYI